MFDFIINIQDYITTVLAPFMEAQEYLFSNGSVYEFQMLSVLYMIVYLLYIIAFIVVIWFVLGLAKSFYYIIKEFF